MINETLTNPGSIAIIGASNHMDKPGGRLVYNLIGSGFKGQVYPVNPKEEEICGLKTWNSVNDLPETDLAILAVSAEACIEAATVLVNEKSVRALIVVAAGFAETGPGGKLLEDRLIAMTREKNVSVLGPNCIGLLNQNYKAIFISPPPEIFSGGADFVSASGALAIFILDLAGAFGLRFGSIFSVGNSASIGVEEVLEYWDINFTPQTSGRVKMVYVEQIRKPQKFYSHIRSLTNKGCHVIVSKPGDSLAGARAALSHTGAFAGDSKASALLIEKASAIRCYSREEMVYLACILSQKPLKGKNIAIITQAGGPAVLLSDQLEKNGLAVPELDKKSQEYFSSILIPGSSTHNPVDMLATAHREQLALVLQHCCKLDYIHGLVVIYGKTGMEDLYETFSLLSRETKNCTKPVYSVLPSSNSGKDEISSFIAEGGFAYPDEVMLGRALGILVKHTSNSENELYAANERDSGIENKRVLDEKTVLNRIEHAGLCLARWVTVNSVSQAGEAANLQFPLVAKVMGILHKTEVGGVIMPINNSTGLLHAIEQLLSIEGATGVLVQEMLHGTEIFIGGKRHPGIGYSVHAGLGGIFVELAGDVSSCLAPVNFSEARTMLNRLKAQKIFTGYRNLPPVDFGAFAETIVAFSKIFSLYPDIDEIDLNPLIAKGKSIIVADARIIIG
ncbi:MAG: acetate--CoA ligase family protein [Bacteroidales bacterium]|nr:acetate--CoA ligase family protein [Bacteroidales bacterium]